MNVARTKQVMDMNELHASIDETQTEYFLPLSSNCSCLEEKQLSIN